MSSLLLLICLSITITCTVSLSVRPCHKRLVAPYRLSLHATTSEAPSRTIINSPVFDEQCKYSGITLTRYLVEFVTINPKLRELESLVLAIQTACKSIAHVVERASISGLTGLESGGGAINIQGEEQKRFVKLIHIPLT